MSVSTGVPNDEIAVASAPPRRPWWKLTWLGTVVGVLAFGAALTPSLLPRPWIFEGVIAGFGFALGYGVGNVVAWLLRGPLHLREPTASFMRWAWRALAVLGPIAAIYFLLLGVGWQNEVRTLVGMEDEGLVAPLQVLVVAVPVALLTIAPRAGCSTVQRRGGAHAEPMAADVAVLGTVGRGGRPAHRGTGHRCGVPGRSSR